MQKKNQQTKKTNEIYIKIQNLPKFEQGVLNNVG
jgi:DNA-binding Xre family transcriptional regulator